MQMMDSRTPFRFARRTTRLKPSAVREILKAAESPSVISFAGGLPAPELFPAEVLADVCREVLQEDAAAALQYGVTEGYVPLRKWVSEHLLQTVNLQIRPERILITSGSQQALDLVARVFIDPDDVILMENPSYLGALQAFEASEAKLIGVRTDRDGICPDSLRQTLASLETPPKFLYLISNFQNPTGVTTTLARRREIAAICADANLPVLEDDPYGRLRYSGQPIPALSSFPEAKHWIYLGTSSKILAPGLRVAWVACPNDAIFERLVPVKQAADLHTASFTQRAVYRYVSRSNLLDQHVERLTRVYRARRDAMHQALTAHLPAGCSWNIPDGGLFFWVRLPEQIDTQMLLPLAAERQVVFVPGAPFWVGQPVKNTMRLNFSNAAEERIQEGARRLGEAIGRMIS
jgi:2-aminoadipate transaminase